MKKICFFSGDITRSGGTERVGTVIANQLVKNKKFDICFLSLWENNDKLFYVLNDKIKRYALFEKATSGKRILTYVYRLRKFVKNNNIDVLIDIDGILDLYSIPALRGAKCKLISWEQFNYYYNPDGPYRKITRKWAAKKADAIVVLTDEDKQNYKKEARIKGKITRIYNPMESFEDNNVGYNPDSKLIISAGRLTAQKGFDMLVDVADIVLKTHPDWKWIICGEGEERELLEDKIRKYGLEQKLILQGNVKNIEDYYRKSAMFVLTSRAEGFGLVLTEAKKEGLPCVSFRCPAGPSEIILDGVNGYLIDCFDIKTMSEKINVLIEKQDIRKRFSDNSVVGTEKFNIDKIGDQWMELIEQI